MASSEQMMLQSASLSAIEGVCHGFFTRRGGVSRGIYASLNGGVGSQDDPSDVSENRARMAAALGSTPKRFLTPYQIHSATVVIAHEPWPPAQRPRADAVVTTIPGLAIGVSTADCGPVLFADPVARVGGAAHAGWRGAFSGVIEATVSAMEHCGARRGNIVAALGPMIRQPSYEVGPEFRSRLVDADARNKRFFRPSERDDHALFDLPGYITARLATCGITQIEDIGRCTYAEPDLFYSFRRATHRGEPDYGRHINAIALIA